MMAPPHSRVSLMLVWSFNLEISPPRLDSEEDLAKGDDARDVQDRVWGEVMHLQEIGIENFMKVRFEVVHLKAIKLEKVTEEKDEPGTPNHEREKGQN